MCVCENILVLIHRAAALVTIINNRQLVQQRRRLLCKLLKNLQRVKEVTMTTSRWGNINQECKNRSIVNKPVTHQPLVEPVAVVVVQTSAKVVRQLTRFNVTGELIG